MNAVRGQGDITEQTHDITGFTKVSFEISGDVYLSQSDNYNVRIETKENLHTHIKFEVKDEELRVYSRSLLRNTDGTKLYIDIPVLEGVRINGSNNVFGSGIFKSESTLLSINGSGNMEMDIDTENLEIEINGSGNIQLTGSAKNQVIEINGSGQVQNQEILSEIVDTESNGSGNCEVNVSSVLNSEINGSGSVAYSGSPESVNTEINGSGRVYSTE